MVEHSTLFCFSLQEGSKASANKEPELATPVQGRGNVSHLRDASGGSSALPPSLLLRCCLLKQWEGLRMSRVKPGSGKLRYRQDECVP